MADGAMGRGPPLTGHFIRRAEILELLRFAVLRMLAAAIIKIHKLVCHLNVANYVEFPHGLQFGRLQRNGGCRKEFALQRVFGPLAAFGEVFQRLRIFDEDVHKLVHQPWRF